MIKLYLILFSSDIKREELTKFFDINPQVINFWFYNLPSSVFIKSTLSASQLQAFILGKFGNTPSLFIIEVNSQTNYSGWIDKDHLQYFATYLPK